MKKALIPIVLLIAFLSCSLLLAPQIVIIDSPYPREHVIEAIDDFSYAWSSHFDEDITEYLQDITIEFWAKNPWKPKEGCYRGVTNSRNKITIAYPVAEEYSGLDRTAFWHELTHLALWNIPLSPYGRGDPDDNHEEGSGPWTDEHNEMVQELKSNWRNKYGKVAE